MVSKRPIQIVGISSKDNVHRDLAAYHVQVLDGCRRTVLVSIHQLKQNPRINTPKQKQEILTHRFLVTSACQGDAIERRNLVGVSWVIS